LAKRLAFEQRLSFVAAVCPDGTPNVTPKETTACDDSHLVSLTSARPERCVTFGSAHPSR
jgi:hypothetical protein